MTVKASESIWRGRFNRWQASGLSLHEFGAREKVSAKSLPWWMRRLKQFELESATSMTLVRVAEGEPSAAVASGDIELLLPTAVRLRVPFGARVQQVVELVTALGAVRFR